MRLVAGVVCTAISCIPCGAFAEDSDLAKELGMVLASEQLCGLAFKPEAIQKFIDARVQPGDTKFPVDLTAETGMRRYYDKDIPKTDIVARCAQIRRVAKFYSFID